MTEIILNIYSDFSDMKLEIISRRNLEKSKYTENKYTIKKPIGQRINKKGNQKETKLKW